MDRASPLSHAAVNSNPTTPVRGSSESKPVRDEARLSKSPSPTPSKSAAGTPSKSEDVTGTFTWQMKHFSKTHEKKVYSEPFMIGEYKWRILVFPRGNNESEGESISLYLDALGDSSSTPWQRYANFTLSVVNQNEKRRVFTREAHHVFTPTESDWGFTNFMKLPVIYDEKSGYLTNDTLTIDVYVRVSKNGIGTGVQYDSKKETGYVGLRNQGATCYMNSLLQVMFHTCSFRRSVYQIPTYSDTTGSSIPYALQKVFYQLQTSECSVGTKDLTKSFGWDNYETFTQHDVQELNRVLCDNLEQKMKGTAVEGHIPKLYEGKIHNYIKCLHVAYESKREESFYDLSLNVKGCKDIYESFDKYTEEEILEGENKYQAEGHGLQEARKGVNFYRLPPVLYLQLKRFEYDPNYDCMVKVNDRYVFYKEIDLDRYMSPGVSVTEPNHYVLKGILVHAGDVHGGHYFAFIQPTATSQWFKFDDERVSKVSEDAAVEDSFGGEEIPGNLLSKKPLNLIKKYANAYMLIYMKKQQVHELLRETKLDDIPEELRNRLEYEKAQDEMRRKERAEGLLNMTLKIVTLKDLEQNSDVELTWTSKVPEYKVRKTSCMNEFKGVAQDQFGIPAENQRYWFWTTRENRTSRIYKAFAPKDEAIILSDLFSSSGERIIFLEDTRLSEPIDDISSSSLLFFKVFIPSDGLRFLTYKHIAKDASVGGLTSVLKRGRTEPVSASSIYEEKSPSSVVTLCLTSTISEAGLIDGDIIVFNLDEGSQSGSSLHACYEYLQNRIFVSFRPLEKPKDVSFVIECSKYENYDDIIRQVSEVLKIATNRIRLTSHNANTDSPKHHPLRSYENLPMHEIVSCYPGFSIPASDIMYYEVVESDVALIENMRAIRVSWFNKRCEEMKNIQINFKRNDCIKELKFQTSLNIEVKDPKYIRVMEVWNSKITRIFQDHDALSLITEHSNIRAEEIEPEEFELDERNAKYIQVQHFSRVATLLHPFGNPFLFIVNKGEKFSSIQKRIYSKLGYPPEHYDRWKYAIVSFGKPDYLTPDRTIFDYDFLFNNAVLGLEHSAPRMASARVADNKPVKLYN